jgi:hypothetical protein
MAEQRTIEVGNAIIVLTSPNDFFSDGLTTGYLDSVLKKPHSC